MPWSSNPSTSFLAAPDEYRSAAEGAGLTTNKPIDRLGLIRRYISRDEATSKGRRHLVDGTPGLDHPRIMNPLTDVEASNGVLHGINRVLVPLGL